MSHFPVPSLVWMVRDCCEGQKLCIYYRETYIVDLFYRYGFNPGSVLYVASQAGGALAGLVAVNTTLAACAGAISAMAFSSYIDLRHTGIYSYDVVATMNGCLTGLVA
jgi:hypothetical protein